MIEPIVLFGIQFTFALLAFALIAAWYVWPRLSPLPAAVALVPLLWVHVFRVVGGSILAPGSVGPGVPSEFREWIAYGDLAVAALALIAVIALRAWGARGMPVVWVFVVVALVDTVNAIIQAMRFHVFDEPLGFNWVVVTLYVPALLVTTYLILVELVRGRRTA